MRIAVTSRNFRTITPHAGMTRRFLVYEAERGGAPVEIDRLDLPKELAIHEYGDRGPHPLDGVDAVIAGSAGAGFIRHMAARGVKAVATSETDPVTAVAGYLAGTLPLAEPDEQHGADDEACCCCGARHDPRMPA